MLEVDADFPGGNIIVDKIRKRTIYVHQDIRDTEGYWFYWYLRIRKGAGQKITVKFPDKRIFTSRGPAVSLDQGQTWQWMWQKKIRKKQFTFSIPQNINDIRFCFGMAYLQSTLTKFIQPFQSNPAFNLSTLCMTPKGRSIECLSLGAIEHEPEYRILIVARHHACEMMANYVLEGIIQGILGDSPDGNWLRQKVEFRIIPFMDKDGVEEGDQGKNRRPRDHNRDYSDDSLYCTTKALRESIPQWLNGKQFCAFDLHCPCIYDEKLMFIGQRDLKQWENLTIFSNILEKNQQSFLKFYANDNKPFGQGWNTDLNEKLGKTFGSWAWSLPNPIIVSTLETPYASVYDQEVNSSSARQLGQDLLHALIKYIKKEF